MANKIIYDSAITGHHSEYISHLVNYIINDEINNKQQYIFIVPVSINEKFSEIVKISQICENIIWEFIPDAKCEYLQSLPLYKRSFEELKLVEKYALKFRVKEVFLLYFNIFQLALIFKRPSFQIKGILFLQFFRMQKNTISDKLKYYRKYWITRAYSWNSKIIKIFILNDITTADYLNAEFNTGIFKMLPDPIPIFNEEIGFDIYNYYNIPKNKKILLHPGAIDPRKGTYEIINAINYLKESEKELYAILIVGKAKPDIQNSIESKLKMVENKNFFILFDNSFVSNERLKSLFLQSYAILMPYKNSEASSGILGHAAISRRIVLAPNEGLIGEIIKKYELGILIDKSISRNIAKGIEELSYCNINNELAGEFVKEHSLNSFTKTLLK